MVPSCCTYSTAFHLDITSYQGAEASAAGSYSAGWHKTRGAATKLGVWDVLEESGVGLAGLLELGLDEVGVSYGGPKDGEALFCGQSGVADPNVGA